MASWIPSIAGDSHEGVRGKKNEDSWGYFAVSSAQNANIPANQIHILIVADGVTGQAGGEQASKIAVSAIQEYLNRPSSHPLRTRLEEALALANQEILTKAEKNPDWGRMSTTVVLAALEGDQLTIAHVGDSRAYLVRDGTAYLLTLDHTWVQEAIDGNRLSQEEAKTHPNRHTILRYLGINRRVESDLRILIPGQQGERTSEPITLQLGDGLLLCSDGLSDKVKAQELAQIVTDNYRNPKATVQHLIGQALQRQEADNITALLATLPANKSGMLGLTKYWPANRLLVTFLTVLILAAFAFGVRGFFGTSSAGNGPTQEVPVNSGEGQPTIPPTVVEANPSVIAVVHTVAATSTPPPMDTASTPTMPPPQKDNAPAAMPTPTDTPPPTFTSSPTATPAAAESNATIAPPTSTRGPTAAPPTATATATATVAPQPLANNTPIPRTSATASAAPVSADFRVELVSPADGVDGSERVTFQWRPVPLNAKLPAGFCYEVQLQRAGSATERNFGVGGVTTATQVEDNLRANQNVSPNTAYNWSVWLAQCSPYQPLRVISEVRVLKSPPPAPGRDN